MTDQPTRYRHRTTEVEAVQWTGDNAEQLRAFAGSDFDEIELDDRVEDPEETAAVREADHGTWRGLKPGDWVVKGGEGFYEFTAADFAEQYEPAVQPPAADRAAVSAKLWAIAEHHIVAEWICCEPLDPKHDLCAKGYAALGMAKTLLVDSPEAWNPNAPLLDAVLAVLPASAGRAAVLREAADAVERLIAEGEHDPDCLVDELRRMASEARPAIDAASDTPQHACDNCEGVDPDTCLMNPDRPPEQCPNSEFDGYGLQCQKPAGHNLCSFEEQAAAAEAQQDGAQNRG